jgi:hypothetical protein
MVAGAQCTAAASASIEKFSNPVRDTRSVAAP